MGYQSSTHPQGLLKSDCSGGSLEVGETLAMGKAVAIAGLSSQNPGVITIANAVFGSKPDISGDILAKAFQVDNNVISQIQAKF
ncbi:hypothetical protein GH714_016878 [Hevea brasiliensis]|uniref:Cupin type-1 domain-containing protein n=1 Tax=Hevea brasiliensis TaxID=3981 RepID=A0A6A6ME31_HEVBR|nr:hypothetical protein GH714_016878 [Hevea brasiliensis]